MKQRRKEINSKIAYLVVQPKFRAVPRGMADIASDAVKPGTNTVLVFFAHSDWLLKLAIGISYVSIYQNQ